MAHFAKLDKDNVVVEVIVVHNNEVSAEAEGVAFLTTWSGGHTNWKQTSYNAKFRGRYAGIGDIYDPVSDIFVHPVALTDESV